MAGASESHADSAVRVAATSRYHTEGDAREGREASETAAENDSYSRDEFGRIRSAAKGEARRALRRIRANTEKLHRHRETGDVGDGIAFNVSGSHWTTGSLLDYLSQNGMLPSQYLANRVVLKGCFDLTAVSNPAQALFPSIREIYC